jgi:hypothetical protein
MANAIVNHLKNRVFGLQIDRPEIKSQGGVPKQNQPESMKNQGTSNLMGLLIDENV